MRSILSLGVATELAVTAFERALLHHHKEDGDENQSLNGGCNHSADNRGHKGILSTMGGVAGSAEGSAPPPEVKPWPSPPSVHCGRCPEVENESLAACTGAWKAAYV